MLPTAKPETRGFRFGFGEREREVKGQDPQSNSRACYGIRDDVEPCLAVDRELMRRGHAVRMAVPPDLVGFSEAAGPATIPSGPAAQPILDTHRNFWTCLFTRPWRIRISPGRGAKPLSPSSGVGMKSTRRVAISRARAT